MAEVPQAGNMDVINIKVKTMEPATYDIQVSEQVGTRQSPLLLPAG